MDHVRRFVVRLGTACMAPPKAPEITERDITGLKYFRKLDGLLTNLHDVGCERDLASNRTLHMDQYCMLVLLYLFNPILTS